MAEREVETVERKDEIVSGKTFLGIEFGSTRIKAVLTDANHTPIASGSHEWENRLDHGIWTYTKMCIRDRYIDEEPVGEDDPLYGSRE